MGGLRVISNNPGDIIRVGEWGNYWSKDFDFGYPVVIYFASNNAYLSVDYRANGNSVRLIKSEPQIEEVVIGTQTWMLKNLDIDDGGGGIYAYNNDENNVPIYGRLYTWDAAVRIAASIDGWHLPSDAEWTALTDYLGGESIAGGKINEAGITHWDDPNNGATNESGFTALPGGFRNSSDGTFYYLRRYAHWWSSTEEDESNAYFRVTDYWNEYVAGSWNPKLNLYSVRLIKD
jgi:uncharacterized protein (TIGR02145 family)